LPVFDYEIVTSAHDRQLERLAGLDAKAGDSASVSLLPVTRTFHSLGGYDRIYNFRAGSAHYEFNAETFATLPVTS